MNSAILSETQRDALQEVANIGMGQAGASIASILGEFVHLSIPRIYILNPDEIGTALTRIVGDGEVSAVSQAFHGQMRGEAVVIYGRERCNDLAELMGYEGEIDPNTESELLLDVTNVLVGACLGGISEQLRLEIGFSAPSVVADRARAADLIRADEVQSACALFVEVNFRLEQRSFACHLVILMPEDEIRAMGAAVERFIESY